MKVREKNQKSLRKVLHRIIGQKNFYFIILRNKKEYKEKFYISSEHSVKIICSMGNNSKFDINP